MCAYILGCAKSIIVRKIMITIINISSVYKNITNDQVLRHSKPITVMVILVRGIQEERLAKY